MKILITGATGAVGRDLIPHLLEDPAIKILTVNLSTEEAFSVLGERKNLLHCGTEDAGIVKRFNPDAVIHMASYVTSACDIETGIKLVDSNIIFGIKLLEYLKQSDSLKLFINFGSFAEFIEGPGNKLQNAYLYSASKTAFRAFAEFYATQQGFSCLHVVPYTIYGTLDARKKVIDYVYDSFFMPEPVNMTAGEQILDFIHIDDICSIIERIIYYKNPAELDRKNIFMGTGTGISIRELATVMGEILDREPNINWGGLPYRKGDIMHAVADVSSLKLLGYQPSVILKEGLTKYLTRKNLLK